MKGWWLRIARFALPQWREMSLMTVLLSIGVALQVLRPWPLKLIVDYVLRDRPLPDRVVWLERLPSGDSPAGLLGWLVGGTVLLFMAGKAVGITRSYIQAGAVSCMVYGLGATLFEHLQRRSLLFHGRCRSGDMVRRVTQDTACIRELVVNTFFPLVTAVMSLAAMFAVMWQLDPWLSLLALLVAVPLGLLIRWFSQPLTERNYEKQVLEGERMALAEQTLSALPVIKAFGREDHEVQRYQDLSERTLRADYRALFMQLQYKIGVSGTTAVGTAGLMAVGGLRVLDGTLTLGDLLVFLSYLASLYGPMETLAYVSSGFASAAAKARRVLEVFDEDDRVPECPQAQPVPDRPHGQRGQVRFESVTFGYEKDRPVLIDITLEARPGEKVALVGHTGAGKSTLVSLIPRFYDPWQGRIFFDGVDVRDLQLASLRAHLSLVLQEPFLLPLTIADNIAYARPGASRREIEAAAKAAHANAFIERLPSGYDTVIGERGCTLSGGEKQRLAIARALLKDTPVLILDEPTASLDAKTESLLLEALERLMDGRTTFIIAHRMSTIRGADQVIAIDHGRIVHSNTHEKLRESGDNDVRLGNRNHNIDAAKDRATKVS